MSSSTEELALLERVFLRVGSAESDEQFESIVNKFLIPVLLKLASPNEGVRKKVMELLVHINKRIKRQPSVQLPVEALLTQYRDPNASSFFLNFSILYIKLGFPRLPSEKQVELAPILLWAIEGKPKIHQESLLLLLTNMAGSIKVGTDIEETRKLFKMDEKPELMKQFCSFMLDMLLLPYFHSVSNDGELINGSQSISAPPGMSENGFKRVTSGETPMTPERLQDIKLGIVKLLATGLLPPNDIICHLIIAAADTRFMIANLADTELKRITGSVDWSRVAVASRLFYIYLGSPEVPAEKKNLIPPANRVAPANARIRLKILPFLSRLEKDAILFPGSLQVIFSSLYDKNTNAKLKLQALNFALAIVRKSDIEAMKKMSGMLYTGLIKLVANKEESEQLRVVGYTVIGEIVKRVPSIINKDFIQLHSFFENLTSESPNIRRAVRDSMLAMIDALKHFIKEGKNDSKSDGEFFILALLTAQIESKEPMARFVAVKYAAAAFEVDHVPSRYLLLLASGDSNSDVSSVALQSLYFSVENGENCNEKMPLPDFRGMCQFVFDKAQERIKSHKKIGNHESPFNDATFKEVLSYLRLCLLKSSGVEVNSSKMPTHPCDFSPAIGRYISHLYQLDQTVMDKYLFCVETYLTTMPTLVPINCLIEVVGTCPEIYAVRYAEKIQWLMNFLGNMREDIREAGAILFSIVSVYTMNDDELSEIIRNMMEKLTSKSLENQHGAILSLGHLIEKKISKTQDSGQNFYEVIKNWEFFGIIVTELAKHLENSHSTLISASSVALGLIGKVLPLPLPNESEDGLSIKKIMKTLLDVVNNQKLSGKVKEKAIQTCGLLCLGENFPFTKELVEELFSTAKQTKDVDLLFSLSDSVILCLEGISSIEKCNFWKVEKSSYVAPSISQENLNLLDWLMNEMIRLTPLPHPNVRQAICVFFLSILKRLSHLEAVKSKLSSMQSVFMELLSENNELVQDMSSKGLAMVYDYSTEENKKKLVADLLDQFLAGKRAVQQVTDNTKLFEEGELGVTPSGGSLSTYKELCSLASDLNQPFLIYKFMQLANNNAVWNSKKGAAFGFQTIVAQANDQLNEYLPKIVPRLYRYQFDPTPRIQQSMSNIWHSIVKDTQKTLDKYFSEILDDLLLNLTSNQWRVRISCCQALADFFRGNRSLLDAKPKLSQLWKSLFRVMDDIHEGTRIAAHATGKTLANLTLRLCDRDGGKISQEMLDISLKIFLSEITNPVAEIKNLCLHTVSQLVGSAGPSLKPNLPTLIPSLLEAAGELESVKLSYLSAQYGGQAQNQEAIDFVRANIAKSHYTTQTLTKCIQHVEIDMLNVLVPRITEIMKSVSFGSRIACSHIVILLAHHLGKSMEQYTGKLLSGLVNGLLDRNAIVRKSYASAIGQIIHTAKSSTIEKLFKKLSTWYFTKEDSNVRTAIGCTLQAVAHYNGELLKEEFPTVIPLIFFAMHASKAEREDNNSVEMWEDIWNDVTLGSKATIRQHISEISAVLNDALNSPSWTMKAQAGRCIATIATKIGSDLEETHQEKLIDMLLSSLTGKTFPGKEELLKGLSKLAFQSSESLKNRPDKCQIIVEAIIRECNKTDLIYRRHGVEALGEVLEAFDNIDYFQKVYEIIQSLLKQLNENTEENESPDDVVKLRNEKFKTIEVTYKTLGKAWPNKKETQVKYQEILLDECYKALETSPRDVQVAILSAFRSYIDKLYYFNEDYVMTSEEKQMFFLILEKTTQALQYSLGIQKHLRLRKEALYIVHSLGNKLEASGKGEELKNLMDSLRSQFEELEKDSTPEVRTILLDLKHLYKN